MSTRRKVLVVSDRFPPETDGGAELSLHDTLAAIDRDQWELRVIALSERDKRSRTEMQGDMRIDRVFSGGGFAAYMGVTPGRGVVRAVRATAGYLLSKPRRFPSRLRELATMARLAMAGRREHLGRLGEVDRPPRAATALVQQAIDEWQPDLVHYDNKDSILIARGIVHGDTKSVAMVRDSRFFCGHPKQLMLVDGQACESCLIGCIADLPKAQRNAMHTYIEQANRVRGKALASVDRVITTSRYLAKQIAGAGHGLPVAVIGNPHPLAEIFPASEPADPPQILFAGNLRVAKGPMVLVECLGTLAETLPDFRIVFAGKGPLQRTIEARAAKLGLADRVTCAGFLDRDAMAAALTSATVVVAPTLWPEPFGRLPLEAAIARRPIVATALGGHVETIVDGKTGIMVPPNDPEALATAIIGLIADPDRAKAMGDAAFDHIADLFAPATIASRLSYAWTETTGLPRP